MKQRETEKPKARPWLKLPKIKFSKEEIEFLLTLKAQGMDIKNIAATMTEKFGTPRSIGTIYQKLRTLRDNGIPNFDRKSGDVKITYDPPKNSVEAYAQLELAMKILESLKQYHEVRRAADIEVINTTKKMQKIKELLN